MSLGLPFSEFMNCRYPLELAVVEGGKVGICTVGGGDVVVMGGVGCSDEGAGCRTGSGGT